MFSPSKENTENIINILSNFLRKSSLPDNVLGIFIVCIHIIFGLWMIFSLIFKKVNYTYYLYIFVFILVIYSNYYFHGCILTRLEINFLSLKEWFGPATLMGIIYKLFSCDFTKNTANLIIKYCIATPLSIIAILKTLFNGHYLTSSLLFCFLTPLLFIDAQHNMFGINKKIDIDVKGKIIAITGCSSGLGEHLVKKLHSQGATVILLNRMSEHATNLHKSLENSIFIECDLANFKSVLNAAKCIKNQFPDGIDVLFNNAGISNCKPTLTADKFDIQIQTNFLSHVLLTQKLICLLKRKENARIINHISIAYSIPNIDYDPRYFMKNPTISESIFEPQILYQQSKLALLLYSNSLSRKLKNTNISVSCVHPGICNTDIFDKSILPTFIKNILLSIASSKETCTSYLLDAITSKEPKPIFGPSVFFMDFNSPSSNIEMEDKIYNETIALIRS